MSQPTTAEWAAIRNKWENTPRLTFGEAGESFAVSKQAVAKRAKKEGWEKVATLSAINLQAHRKADKLSTKVVDVVVGGVVEVVDSASVDTQAAVDIRATTLSNQRKEIELIPLLQDKAVSLFYTAIEASEAAKISDEAPIRNREKTAWYIAKMACECVKTHAMVIQLKQDSEAKAWGLDQYQFEDRLLPNLNLLTIEEMNQIVETGKYPASWTKGWRE